MTPKEHAKVLAALEAVAPEEPINQDEQGGCVWCGGTPPGSPYGYATSNRTHHEEDCCWVLARDAIAIMRKEPEPISDAEILDLWEYELDEASDVLAFARKLLEKAK